MQNLVFATMAFALAFFFAEAAAQGGIGTSSIVLSSTSVNVVRGASASVNYTVQLSSGTTWGTTISANNTAYLSSKGISLSFSNSYGDPTYSGVLKISTAPTAAPGTYTVQLYATGDDPTAAPAYLKLVVATSPSQNSTASITGAYLATIATAGVMVNASAGATVKLDNTITAIIPTGTYAMVNGTKLSSYNFSIIDLRIANNSVSKSFPSPNASLVPYGAYAFAVNGQISPNIEFVNSSGKPQAIKSIVVGGQNDTSWTWLGGTWNGTYYIGGRYAFADSWTHPNSSSMVNGVFFKPVIWVFEEPAPVQKTTPPSTTTPPPTTTPPSTTVPYTAPSNNASTYVAIVVIVIIVAAGIAYLLFRRR